MRRMLACRRMRTRARALAVLCVFVLLPAGAARAQAPVGYRVSFPSPEHRWMQVEVTFADVPAGPAAGAHEPQLAGPLRPARVRQERVRRAGEGRPGPRAHARAPQSAPVGRDRPRRHGRRQLPRVRRSHRRHVSQRGCHAWSPEHAGLADVGARTGGARGARASSCRRRASRGSVATQLFPTGSPLVFTAPEPAVLDGQPHRSGRVRRRAPSRWTTARARRRPSGSPCITTAPRAEADAFAKDVETIVRETLPIFGEFPRYDGGTYTFLSDYLPWASGDGMEHRNSTVLSSSGALRNPAQRSGILGTVAHEFFHGWNMERIRSRARRAVRLRRRQHVGRALVRRGLHQLLRHDSSPTAPVSIRSPTRSTTWPTSSTPSRSRPAAPSAPPSR